MAHTGGGGLRTATPPSGRGAPDHRGLPHIPGMCSLAHMPGAWLCRSSLMAAGRVPSPKKKNLPRLPARRWACCYWVLGVGEDSPFFALLGSAPQ
jgi:hypothetical protein